jgi:hypothetical protein
MTHFKPHDDDNTDFGAEYGREVLFEVIRLGNSAKVTAIDSATGTEVSLVGPANSTTYSLKANAMRKLMNALGKDEAGEGQNDPRAPRRPGRYA